MFLWGSVLYGGHKMQSTILCIWPVLEVAVACPSSLLRSPGISKMGGRNGKGKEKVETKVGMGGVLRSVRGW